MIRYYYGLFPPPYGGVTIKNELLYSELQEKIDIKKTDIEKAKKNPILLIKAFLRIIFARKSAFVIALSVGGRRRITPMLFRFNKKAMKRSLLLVMGGAFARNVAKDDKYAKMLRMYKTIYVETEGMEKDLVSLGFNNVKIYPNCRKNIAFDKINPTDSSDFRCLFFSRISKEKGADNVLFAAANLKDVTFDFYGEVDEDYYEEFTREINQLDNAHYKGVFRGNRQEANNIIHGYDVLLLPTRWKNEGIPGILVEGKFAGVPAIVSDICFNSEIIRQDEGIVLANNDVDSLTNAISLMKNETDMTDKMKANSRLSSKRYDIASYIEDIISELR